jgi:hypothetical protein
VGQWNRALMAQESRMRNQRYEHRIGSGRHPMPTALEHGIYQEDAVLEYPQSGERIRGRHNIQITRRYSAEQKALCCLANHRRR